MFNRILSSWNWCKIVLQKLRLTKSSQNCNNTYVGRSPLLIFILFAFSCQVSKPLKPNIITRELGKPMTKEMINLLDSNCRFYMINRDTTTNSY